MPAKRHYRATYDKQYILSRIAMDEKTGCWNWTRFKTKRGYGEVTLLGNKPKRAHRLSYEIWHGPIGDFQVCHRCDNPPCCNPDHLFLGTQRDNNLDMTMKGRCQKGTDRKNAKLTEDDVRTIRASSESLAALADRFGVNKRTVLAARRRERWKHVQ